MIHSTLLRDNSNFFASALNGRWKESGARAIEMPEDDPDDFTIYATWIHHRTIPTSTGDTDEHYGEEESALISAYGLGEKLGDDDFCDAALDVLVEICNMRDDANVWLSEAAVTKVYEVCLPGSPLRKMVVDLWLCHGKKSWFDQPEGITAHLSKEFLLDYLKASICSNVRNSEPGKYFEDDDDDEEDDADYEYKSEDDDDGEEDKEDIEELVADKNAIMADKSMDKDQIGSTTVPWHFDACAYHRHRLTPRPCYKSRKPLVGEMKPEADEVAESSSEADCLPPLQKSGCRHCTKIPETG